MANIAATISPIQDPTNIYYMHPTDNPGTILVTLLLMGPNYHSWCREMLMALKYKNKLQFIDGTLRKLDINDPTYGS
ncbi:putative gag-polypeptide of LTR copia-type [Lupinus albus]|uniref:Putative gag-polypeptide of LTR copia-type n=1 Tax=Lupinus albus TaxID=3870 RepID=A0A6A4NX04_LUPAL|nr:putative gag-polypeptide of LTR copia-type [Lupinus albus]